MANAFTAPADRDVFGASAVLSDIWNEAQRTYRLWADNEFGAEVALEQEAQQHQALTDAQQAPSSGGFGGVGANNGQMLLLLAAAVLVVVLVARA